VALTPAALGFRVKSGWAQAVLLAASAKSPRLVACQVALLSDPAEPNSKQPYHVVLELPENEASASVRKLRKIISHAAKDSVSALIKKAETAGYAVCGAALVVGSMVDPASLHNEHIRAHALEGQLFRTLLEEAFLERELPCRVLLEKTAYSTAAKELGKAKPQLVSLAARLGDSFSGPWRAEEKLAALAAILALAKGAGPRTS
jgi:hypothetical protein